jgi:hypothetical protein
VRTAALLVLLILGSLSTVESAASNVGAGCSSADALESINVVCQTTDETEEHRVVSVSHSSHAAPAVPVPVLMVLTSICVWLCMSEPDGAAQLPADRRVLRAFRRIPLPGSRIVIQPPGGKTLVNLETLFRTEADGFTRVVRLLGMRVELRIRPTSFEWVTGDGTRFTTSTPGIAYRRGLPMDSYVSHTYADGGVTVHPRVNTTWSATYRVGRGPWRDVVGTVTKRGAASDLRVVEARPVLVGS